jgi:hypothetical protein
MDCKEYMLNSLFLPCNPLSQKTHFEDDVPMSSASVQARSSRKIKMSLNIHGGHKRYYISYKQLRHNLGEKHGTSLI